MNLRAAELAREGAAPDRLVAGSLGPTGQADRAVRATQPRDGVAAYAEQAGALAEGGVDLLVLETIFALEEAVWAVEGIKSATDLPLVVSFSFDMGTRTMMGLSPTEAVSDDRPARRRGRGRELRPLARGHRRRRDRGPRGGRRRAGLDQAERRRAQGRRRRGRLRGRPGDARRAVARYVEQGARVVGGCCGSTPEHVAAIAQALGR